MYHNLELSHPAKIPYAISVRQFESQLEILRRACFTTVSFREVIEAMRSKEALPVRSVLITFDDGYMSFRKYAVPALRRQGMTATAFLVGREIGGFNRWDDYNGIPQLRLMNQTDIEEIIGAGFEIGSHGWAHRDLLACSHKQLEEEIVLSRQSLQDRFGIAATTFAYPYGRYSEAHYEILACAGFQAAVTCSSSGPAGNPFAMRRVYVQGRDTGLRFLLKLSSLYPRYRAWRGRAASGAQINLR
jgi:peptidoglycan/xylan/chitin deacetylase (PgdA/CDA1 family)